MVDCDGCKNAFYEAETNFHGCKKEAFDEHDENCDKYESDEDRYDD